MRNRKGCELLKRNSSAVRERERERLDALFAEMQSKAREREIQEEVGKIQRNGACGQATAYIGLGQV